MKLLIRLSGAILLIFTQLAVSGAQNTLPYDSAWVNAFGRRVNDAINANDGDLGEKLIAEASDTAARRFGPASREIADVLEWDSRLSLFLGDADRAVEQAERALELKKKNWGARDYHTAVAMTTLAQAVEEKTGNADRVEQLLQGALQILEESGLKYSDESLDAMNSLGLLFQRRGYYDKSIEYMREVLEIEQKLHGKNRYEYNIICSNIASMYGSAERLSEAVEFYTIALEGYEKQVGREHPDYLVALKSLGGIYQRLTRFDLAEKALTEALATARKVYKPDDPQLAVYLWPIANLYSSIGYYEEMGPLMREAYQLVSARLKLPAPLMVTAVIKLADYYDFTEDHANAELLFRELKDSLDAAGQTHDIQYPRILVNLSREYRYLGRNEEAYSLLVQANQLADSILSPRSPVLYRRFRQGWVSFIDTPERLEHALRETITGLEIMRENFGSESLVVAEWDSFIATMYTQKNEPEKAMLYLENAFAILDKRIRTDFPFLSFSQQEAYLNTFNVFFRRMQYFGRRFPAWRHTGGFLYDVALLRKELLGFNNAQWFRKWEQSSDPLLRRQVARYYNLRRELIAVESKPLNQQKGAQSLRDSVYVIEKQLLMTGSEKDVTSGLPNWTQLQHVLKPGEAAVEFVAFEESRFLKAGSQYGALLLKPGSSEPELLLLGDGLEVDSLMDGAGAKPFSYAEKIYSAGPTSKRLYELIWKPLAERLGDVEKIYIAPAGHLLQLNFRALPVPGTNKILSETTNLVCLNSTRQLLDPDFNTTPGRLSGQTLLLGGLDFDHAEDHGMKKEEAPFDLNPASKMSELNVKLSIAEDRGAYHSRWDALPETLVEVRQIDSMLRSKSIPAQTVTGRDGTEAMLKVACSGNRAPTILHIATHGFFYAQPRNSKDGDSDKPGLLFSRNPMLRSGLVFAGANPAWKGSPVPDAAEDGILTAEEVTFLNLQKTDLVVLSACETGLGEIRGYEGVFGLQRAFRLAGAHNLVMTLWRVPDQPTREFMVDFYARLSRGASVRDAFNEAVRFLRKKYPAPYYWAGFVLADGVR